MNNDLNRQFESHGCRIANTVIVSDLYWDNLIAVWQPYASWFHIRTMAISKPYIRCRSDAVLAGSRIAQLDKQFGIDIKAKEPYQIQWRVMIQLQWSLKWHLTFVQINEDLFATQNKNNLLVTAAQTGYEVNVMSSVLLFLRHELSRFWCDGHRFNFNTHWLKRDENISLLSLQKVRNLEPRVLRLKMKPDCPNV